MDNVILIIEALAWPIAAVVIVWMIDRGAKDGKP